MGSRIVFALLMLPTSYGPIWTSAADDRASCDGLGSATVSHYAGAVDVRASAAHAAERPETPRPLPEDRVLSGGIATLDRNHVAESLRVSFRSGIERRDSPSASAELAFRGRSLQLDSLAVHRAAATLLDAGGTEDELADSALAAGGEVGLSALRAALMSWDVLGLLCRTVYCDAGPVASAEPMVPGCSGRLAWPRTGRRVQLSRFACCRRESKRVVLESPLSPTRVVLHLPCAAAALVELAGGTDQAGVAALIAPAGIHAPHDTAGALLGLLIFARLAEELADDERLQEDRDENLALWDFHDLLFHARSRLGPHDYPVGGTFRLRDQVPALSALPPRRDGAIVDLPHIELDRSAAADPSFTHVLERRRSVRQHGADPISLEQLGEFLYRTARVRRLIARDDATGMHYEATDRPYPSGGSAYDIELYVVVSRCRGLAAGVHHYAAGEHRLEWVPAPSPPINAVLREARAAAGLDDDPQILLVLTSRFARVSWKYQSIAYALTLKTVGVIYQTMYLVATAMGLAPCAVGTGDASLMARILGTDYAAESSVGEFVLGSCAAPFSAETQR